MRQNFLKFKSESKSYKIVISFHKKVVKKQNKTKTPEPS